MYVGAMRKNIATKSHTESDLQRKIVKFLRGASDRDGGCQRRKLAAAEKKRAKVAAAKARKASSSNANASTSARHTSANSSLNSSANVSAASRHSSDADDDS